MFKKVLNEKEVDQEIWTSYMIGSSSNSTETDLLKELSDTKYSDFLYSFNNGSYQVWVKWSEHRPELCTNDKLDLQKYAEWQNKWCESLIDFMKEQETV